MHPPRVTCRPMSMNEGLATSCCYRVVTSATAEYWEVLHNGWIGRGDAAVSTRASAYAGLDPSWLTYEYDLLLASGTPSGSDFVTPEMLMSCRLEQTMVKVPWASRPTLMRGWFLFQPNGGEVVSTLDFALEALSIPRGDAPCPHTPGSGCAYLSPTLNPDATLHFESDSAHNNQTALAFESPHEAHQYSS